MRRVVLNQTFFNRPTLKVARNILGNFLVRKIGKRTYAGMITEVETYIGPNDLASHASRLWRRQGRASLPAGGSLRAARGKTKRTEVMFGKPGRWYVYLIYGMHHCLNIVTEKEGYPAAVLIRSVATLNEKLCGPGRICKKFQINRTLNNALASKKSGLWIENRGVTIKPCRIRRGQRIGVDYAGKWKHKLWRFYMEIPEPR